MPQEQKWWKEAVIYQIYPRSFNDSNDDGVGDIRGIIEKLDYIKNLGADVIWLCPVYRSPNDDNGYDISDYFDIQPEFGTMADFDELLSEVHKRDLKIIMDLVVNHTSDENAWFIESRSSKTSDKRDFYIWRKGKGGKEPNNWQSFFTPSAWQFDEKTGEYYLHLFSKKQPDLNWRNEAVRDTVFNMMTWWLNKGIDGFRMDVINCISKKEGLPDILPSTQRYEWAGKYFMNEPTVHTYLNEMNKRVLSKYKNIMTVGETPGADVCDALLFAGNETHELDMIFQSELMDVDSDENGKWTVKKAKLNDFKKVVTKWQTELHKKAWNSIFLGNHDQPRCVSRFGDDENYHKESAKLLAALLLTLEGTPYIFQGDEIGMTNAYFNSVDECRDIESINFYNEALKSGSKESEIMQKIRAKSRDNARTPMQWNSKKNAGFSNGKPWIAINENYKTVNAEKEISDSGSVLNFYRKMIRLRKEHKALIYGEYIPFLEDDEKLFAYLRKSEDETILVILNFSGEETKVSLPNELSKSGAVLLASNSSERKLSPQMTFSPYESAVYLLSLKKS